MEVYEVKNKYTPKELYFLKIFSLLPELPVRPKDLFYLLKVEDEELVENFDALHNLKDDWLEFYETYYVLPKKRQEELRKLVQNVRIDEFMKNLIHLYDNLSDENLKVLKYYEPYVLSIINNYVDEDPYIIDLKIVYAKFLGLQKRYGEAELLYHTAINEIKARYGDNYMLKIKLAEIYVDLSIMAYDQKNIDKAYQYANKSLDYLSYNDEYRFPAITANVYFILGSIFFRQKDYKLALTYYLRSLEALERLNKFNKLYILLNLQIADCYRHLQNYDDSLRYLNKIEKIVKSNINLKDKQNLLEQIDLLKKFVTELKNRGSRLRKLIKWLILFAVIIYSGLLVIRLIISLLH